MEVNRRLPLDTGLGGPLTQSGRANEERHPCCNLAAPYLIPVLTELPRHIRILAQWVVLIY
jgi:hypothetical protein